MSKPRILIGNVSSRIEGIPEDAYQTLRDELSYDIPSAFFIKKTNSKLENWDGKKYLIRKAPRRKTDTSQAYLIKTGLVARTIKTLYDCHEIIVELVDTREKPEESLDYKWKDEIFKLRDYQIDSVKNGIKKTRGVLEVATGGGKTIIASKLIHESKASPFIFYVMTRELLHQAKARMEAAMENLECGVVGDGECDIKHVNVVTVQTATRVYGEDILNDIKYMKRSCDFDDAVLASMKKEDLSHLGRVDKARSIKELIENCKGIYFDEAHHVPARTAQDILAKSKKAYYLFGGTATPSREDGADLMIEGIFGRKFANISASYLIKRGHLMKPDIYYIKLKGKGKRALNYDSDLKENIVLNDERNNHVISIANALAKDDLSVLILVSRIDHGKKLKEQIKDSEFIYGGSTKKKRDRVLKELEDKKTKIVISSTIADEGLDIPSLNCLILAGGGKSANKCKQRVGRVIRKTGQKRVSMVFDFLDTGKYTKKHSKDRMNILKTEEEFQIRVIPSFEAKNVYSPELLF